MPLYEYECQSCHRRLEIIRKFSDPPLEVCPHCGGRLDKLISSPAFHLKGSGWYATDYARKGEKPASDRAIKDTNETTAPADKADKSSPDKPDKKASAEAKPAADSKEPPKSAT